MIEERRVRSRTCCDYRMDLCCAVDSENGDLTVFAEFWGSVGLSFYFFVNFSSSGE